jgi:hypothetical protein
MTKTEQIKHVTKSVIAFMEALGYEVIGDELGSLIFSNGKGTSDDYIDYHRSYQDVTVLPWSSEKAKDVANKLEQFIKLIKQ